MTWPSEACGMTKPMGTCEMMAHDEWQGLIGPVERHGLIKPITWHDLVEPEE